MALPENTTLFSILVVEDNPGDLFLLEESLRQTRLPLDKVYTAASAAEAITILEKQDTSHENCDRPIVRFTPPMGCPTYHYRGFGLVK